MSFADLLAMPGVEERVVLAGQLGFLAFHGGLEGGTEMIASAAAEQSGASLYSVVQPPSLRWHIPSHQVVASASEALGRFLAHVEVAIAVHGYGRVDRPTDILLGGSNRELAALLATHLRAALDGFSIIDDLEEIPGNIRGLHPHNPVNRPPRGGVQLELPPRARGTTARWSDAGATCTPTAGLVEALSATATHWQGSEAPPRAGETPGSGA
ncbi:MAG TPA: poly-gamma-glutamate hydrolase family protein [Acidimicrobiales bacterium]|jgi:phage replication-related protein YjqB (UPF0714/DUF867 family)|nr:poly-gamma-glutamate hydrolase family protein [Acidimicrobiales bacterium]